MGFVAAGLAVAAVGAGVSAYGTAKNAAAIADANSMNAFNEQEFHDDQSKKLNRLIRRKENKLYDLGGIFDRFESTGAFGDTNTLNNLRKAQSDFSALAAGDFTGFESQLRKTLSDSLVGVVGSGAPVGTYAGLAADAQLSYRQQGISTAVGISEFLSNEANKLLGSEFGIMDQKFNTQYELGRTNTTNQANYALGEASTVGVGMQAFGNAAQQIGGSMVGYGNFQTNQSNLNRSYELQRQTLNGSASAQASINRPAVTNPYVSNFSLPISSSSVVSGGGGGFTGGGPIIDLPGETIYPSDSRYNSFDAAPTPSPFSYGSGYTRPTYSPSYAPSGMVLPDRVTSYSALGQVGRNIVSV